MDQERRERRNQIRNIRTVAEYHALMDSVKLSDQEREIADLVFIKALPYTEIAAKMGYSECTIKRKMRRILSMI